MSTLRKGEYVSFQGEYGVLVSLRIETALSCSSTSEEQRVNVADIASAKYDYRSENGQSEHVSV